ncbi:MAG TPA: Mur ligase family protein, partial [Polyangiaceae bacterium]
MWPLSRREIERALGEASDEPDELFTGAAIGSARWERGDLYVALGVNGRDGHARVAEYLQAGGKLAVVDRNWRSPSAIDERWEGAREGCLRVPDVMVAYRSLAALMRSRVRCPVIAIAGANGKTTTKEMLRAILGPNVVATEGTENGHYGVPLVLLDRAITRAAPPDAIVVEIGIDEVGAMREHAALVRPDFAVITSLGEEHLRGLRDADTAAREELSLLDVDPKPRRITADDAVIGAFDGATREVELGGVRVRVPMPGEHHARLAALAIATALALGRTPKSIEEGFASFAPPPGRAHVVRLDRDVVLVDDTFNASPDSMLAAIALAREPVWSSRPKALFLGDMLDLGEASERAHLALVPVLASLAGAHVRLYGDEMKRVATALAGSSLASIAHAPS